MRTLTALFNDFSVHETIELVIDYEDYGNTGCGVFKGGIQNQKGVWLNINCSQMKLSNLEIWSSGELAKSDKI